MICNNCGKREGTLIWTGDGGTLAYIHGQYEMWCEVCVIETQLKQAKEVVKRIPELEKRLEELLEK